MNELNWTEIETVELAIAKALGYRAVTDGKYWDIAAPDGEFMYTEDRSSESGVWQSSILHYGPEWARTTDQAFTLPLNAESWYELVGPGWIANEWGCRIEERHVRQTDFESADSAALAICKAWLKWRTSHP